MRIFLSRALLALGISCAIFLPFAAQSASLPEDATVRVGAFTFPQAAYNGAEEEAARLSAAFRKQLASALQLAGLKVVGPASEEDEATEVDEDDEGADASEAADEAPVKGKEASSAEAASDEKNEDATAEEEEKDPLMAAVEEAERAEKAAKEGAEDAGKAEKPKKKAKSAPKSRVYVLTGVITEYEEKAGAPVNIGSTRRLKASVSLQGTYKVKDAAGKVIVSDNVSASSSRVVTETMDIHAVLQELGKKVFFESSHRITEGVSGKKRVKSKEDAEPGSEDDEYADSPGKRLKSQQPEKLHLKLTL